MHVLIIGGTGLISTAIARQLLEAGHRMTLYNRGISQNRLPAGAETVRGDRKDYAAFEQQFAGKTFDAVLDMVAYKSEDSASAVRAFAGRAAQFIHCSTVCVYSGPVTQLPTTETEPYHSIGQYGKGKIECEKLLLDECDRNGFPATIMRPSHSYGEGGSVIRPFGPANGYVERLRKGKPMVVPGDGTSPWASCHVEDVARGFIGVMGNAKCIGQAYNIAGDEWMTWNTYFEQIAEVVGGSYEPVHIPTDVLGEVAPAWSRSTREIFEWPSIFDNSKIKRDTNYTGQTISWREGVRRNVAWLESKSRLAAAPGEDYEDRLVEAWRAGISLLPRQGA